MKIARIIDTKDRRIWASQQQDGKLFRLNGEPLSDSLEITDELVGPKSWLPPVEPPAIICVALNYMLHIKERIVPVVGKGKSSPDEPVLFLKNPASATGHNQPIRIPGVCEDEVDYEGELAAIIGKNCCNVSREEALDYVFGYTVANDVSARVWQRVRGGSQWCRGKSFDTFAPLGPVMVTADEIPDPDNLNLKTVLNGETVQDGNTKDMIFDVATLISFIAQDTTLLAGTVIMTGTPEGVGWSRDPKLLLHAAGEISIEIENIGRLTNPII